MPFPLSAALVVMQYTAVSGPVVVPAVVAAPTQFAPVYPDRVYARPRLSPQIATVAPLHVPDVTQPVTPESWGPEYPDRVVRGRAPVLAGPLWVAPLYVPDVTQSVTALSWRASYPDRLFRVPSVTAASQPTWTGPAYVPDTTAPVDALSWRATYPDRLWTRLRSAEAAWTTWAPRDPDAAPAAPELSWRPQFPDRLWRSNPGASSRPAQAAPLHVPDVTQPVPVLAWRAVAPDRVQRAKLVAVHRAWFGPERDPGGVVDDPTQDGSWRAVYPDRIWARSRTAWPPCAVAPVAPVVLTYPAVVLAAGPSLYYRLDELSGTFVDQMGGPVGTASGGVTRGLSGALIDQNAAIAFDGTSGGVSVPDAAAHNPGTGSYTIECWFKRSLGASGSEFLINKGTVTSIGGELFISASGNLSSRINGSGPTSASSLNDGGWHHAVVVMDRSATQRGQIYVDGATSGASFDISGASSTDLTGNSEVLWFGRRASGNFFGGALDEVAFYKRALSAGEIAAHYAARLSGPVVAPVLSWRPQYPARLAAWMKPRAAELSRFAGPEYVPDVTQTVTALSWKPTYPDRLWPRGRVWSPPAFLWTTDGTIEPSGEPEIFTLFVRQREDFTATIVQREAFTASAQRTDTWDARIQAIDAFDLTVDEEDDFDAGR